MEIFPHIGKHALIPFLSSGISLLRSHQPHHIQLAVACGIDTRLEFCPQLRVGNENIGHLESCQIEGFAGGSTGDGNLLIFLFQIGKDQMLALENQIVVNLIAHHLDPMFHTDIADGAQLLPAPHPSYGIMGRTKQEQFHLFPDNLLLEIQKINLVSATGSLVEIAAHHPPSVVLNHFRKGIVNRLLNQHRIPRLRVRLNCHCQGKDHAGRLDEPLRLHRPVVVLFHPRRHSLEVVLLGVGIAENTVLYLFFQRRCHIGGGGKIHVCHPQRQHIRRFSPLQGKVIF